MKKSVYIFFQLLLIHGCLGIKPFGDINLDILLVAILFFILTGFIVFRNRFFSMKKREFLLFYVIVSGMVVSMIPAAVFYGQSIFQSILTYRWQLLWIYIPFLLYMSPSRSDIVRSTLWLTLLMFVTILARELFPSFFVISEGTELAKLSGEEGLFIDGFMFAVIPLFHYLDRMRHHVNVIDLVVVILCLSFLFLVQNRSALFPAIIITGYSFLTIKSQNRNLILLIFIVVCLIVAYETKNVWIGLFEETTTQVGDEDYNRVKAYMYFLSPIANPSWITYIFGNGYLSAHSSDLMGDLMSQGVYNSDVGFVGFWNQFGVLPILVFLYMLLLPLITKMLCYRLALVGNLGTKFNHFGVVIIHNKLASKTTYSYFLKEFSVFLLVTSVTVGYYGSASALTCFSLFYYFFQNEQSVQIRKQHSE